MKLFTGNTISVVVIRHFEDDAKEGRLGAKDMSGCTRYYTEKWNDVG